MPDAEAAGWTSLLLEADAKDGRDPPVYPLDTVDPVCRAADASVGMSGAGAGTGNEA